MAERLDVSVLIPVLDEAAILPEAARAMLAQQLDGTAEFLFIDGGSTDGSVEILRELEAADPRVRVLANPARRTPHALNIGLRAARGEFIARMDAHTIYPPGYLAAGIKRLRRGDVEWVSGPQLPVGRDRGSRLVARALQAPLGRGGARFRERLAHEHEVDSGFVGVWRRETLERHGGWDEEWVNDQDMELAARIRQAGGRIICIPEMAAQYVPRSTLRALARQYATYGTFRVKTARRHPQTLRPSQLLPVAVTLTALAAVGAPGRARALARAAAAVYAGALTAAAAAAAIEGGVADAPLPAVWAVMHLSYGAGFLRGCARDGVPASAIRMALVSAALRRGR
ncbi:MAG TPA: glycosyltransferase family 2 protein [Solirubrobacteraceae bacterium]|nr:glycosyltransferase family 2 protein [Solirubrobacteraceae bacterium]